MFLVNAFKEIFVGIVKFIIYFWKSLYVATKFRILEFDSMLQYKFPSYLRALIWIAIIGTLIVIFSFIAGFIGDMLLQATSYVDSPAVD